MTEGKETGVVTVKSLKTNATTVILTPYHRALISDIKVQRKKKGLTDNYCSRGRIIGDSIVHLAQLHGIETDPFLRPDVSVDTEKEGR